MHPVDYAPSQDFGDNPTSVLPADHWIIKQFGNYQPDGHTGTDYPCPIGTPVRAVANGTVLHAGYYGGTYADNPFWISPGFAGYCYVVDHGAFIGIYGHCRDGGALVHAGQRVAEGQILGPSGNTGASTGPHLHFEALPDGYVLNSYMYGRINPARLFTGSLSYAGTTTTPLEEDDMFTDADRALLQATLNKADGGQLRADLGYQNDTLFSKADGAWQNAILADISERLGKTLDKADGGYIVGLLDALKPGSTDAGAIADAVVAAVGKDIAADVVKSMSEKLGA